MIEIKKDCSNFNNSCQETHKGSIENIMDIFLNSKSVDFSARIDRILPLAWNEILNFF